MQLVLLHHELLQVPNETGKYNLHRGGTITDVIQFEISIDVLIRK
jgi:hypothetical protein